LKCTVCFFQGHPVVICNSDDDEIKKLAHKTIEVPRQVDCLQGILTIIPMQLLTLHIAELRNCDVSSTTKCNVVFLTLAEHSHHSTFDTIFAVYWEP